MIDLLEEIVERYRVELSSRGIQATKQPKGTPLAHARWMLQELDELLQVFGMGHKLTPAEADKFNRWLGFVQGVLWTGGVYTIDQMRDHTRPLAQWRFEQSEKAAAEVHKHLKLAQDSIAATRARRKESK